MDLAVLQKVVDRRFQIAARRRQNMPDERSGTGRAKQSTKHDDDAPFAGRRHSLVPRGEQGRTSRRGMSK